MEEIQRFLFGQSQPNSTVKEKDNLRVLLRENRREFHRSIKPPAVPIASNQHHSSILDPPKDLRKFGEGAATFDSWIKTMSQAEPTSRSFIALLFSTVPVPLTFQETISIEHHNQLQYSKSTLSPSKHWHLLA